MFRSDIIYYSYNIGKRRTAARVGNIPLDFKLFAMRGQTRIFCHYSV